MRSILKYLAKNVLLKNFTSYKKIKSTDSFLSVSDFFPYRNDQFKTSFVLENSKAMFDAKECSIVAELVFFTSDGNECFRKSIKINKFDVSINLNDFRKDLDEFGGFFVTLKSPADFIPKFRGYTGFSEMKDKFYSYVHGNFGHLFRSNLSKNKSLAKISNKYFYYSPQVILNEKQEFFILNPYEEYLDIEFLKLSNTKLELIESKSVASFGSYIFRSFAQETDTLPIFRSKSPTLRAIIFEKCANGSFDIFHS